MCSSWFPLSILVCYSVKIKDTYLDLLSVLKNVGERKEEGKKGDPGVSRRS